MMKSNVALFVLLVSTAVAVAVLFSKSRQGDSLESSLESKNKSDKPVCEGVWDTSSCNTTRKKKWTNNETNNCRQARPDGTEEDCVQCSGYFGNCAHDGDEILSSFVKTNDGDYCPEHAQRKRTCKQCKAILGDCDPQTGLKKYMWADNDHNYTSVSTDKYYCPQSELDKISSVVSGDCGTRCSLGFGDCDTETGERKRTFVEGDWCPRRSPHEARRSCHRRVWH